jgi:hypothetical protein
MATTPRANNANQKLMPKRAFFPDPRVRATGPQDVEGRRSATWRPAPAIRPSRSPNATGYVLATDISPNILEFAAENARRDGHRNVETQVMDGELLEVPDSMP